MVRRVKARRNGETTASAIATKYLPKTDRVWFPVDRRTFNPANVFAAKLIDGGIPRQQVITGSAGEIAKIRKQAKLGANTILSLCGNSGDLSCTFGLLIPQTRLDNSWLVETDDLQVGVMALTWQVRQRIVHNINAFGAIEVMHRDGSLTALQIGKGDCHMRSSVLAAALRKNGIPARIVGHEDFFDDGTHDVNAMHWWVEAYLNGKWMHLEPSFALADRRLAEVEAIGEASQDVGAKIAIGKMLLEIIATYPDVCMSLNPRYRKKVAERVIVPEIEVPL